ncbi:MAG: SurA N-terminal domain-containing protein, partial [Verrucomicrobia bacterium]|nr:SurA N-terminal domain-containing protein [Verrucomicrobiota bacterium]
MRRHQTWLWMVIIVVIVISFVIYFSPDAKWGAHGRGTAQLGTIDGQPVTMQEYWQANRETRLLYFLNFQKWPENDERARQMGFELENETYMRLLRLAKVKEEKIKVNDETVGLLVQRLLGPKMPLDTFVKEVLLPNRISEADFERFLRNDAAIQQLGAVAGLPGRLIPPRDLEATYREEHEELALEGVFLMVSNYLSNVTVTDSNVLQWYTNNMALFRVPEKVRVSYVDFNRSNFWPEVEKKFAEITNLNYQLEQIYLKDPSVFKDESGKPLTKEAGVQKIRETERNKAAMVLAARKANEFASKLYDETNHTAGAFEKYAAAQGYLSRVSQPFDESEAPPDLKVGEAFVRIAFTLTNKEEAIGFQPAEGEEGFFVLAMKEQIPSSNPAFESIRNKVVERYRLAEAQKLVRQNGYTFSMTVSNALAQGKTFAAAATEAGLKSVPLPPISRALRQAPELPESVSLPQLKNVAFRLQVGESSSFLPTMDGGFILYLRSKLPFNEAKMKDDLVEYASTMRAQRQNEAFGLWFRKQAERADLPINRSKQGGQGAAKTPAGRPGGAPPRP